MNANIYKMYNSITRKFEEVDIEEAELLPGQEVVKMFWCNSIRKYITIPGASRHVVTSNLELALAND